MDSRCVDRRRMAVAGGAVLIAVGVLTAGCGTSGNQAPSIDHDDDNDHHHYGAAAEQRTGVPDRKEHQPDWGKPVHTAGGSASRRRMFLPANIPGSTASVKPAGAYLNSAEGQK